MTFFFTMRPPSCLKFNALLLRPWSWVGRPATTAVLLNAAKHNASTMFQHTMLKNLNLSQSMWGSTLEQLLSFWSRSLSFLRRCARASMRSSRVAAREAPVTGAGIVFLFSLHRGAPFENHRRCCHTRSEVVALECCERYLL